MSTSSPAIQALLDLYSTDLADVRFGDLDAAALKRLAAEEGAAAQAVIDAEAAVVAARAALVEKQEVLSVMAQRALAYARVYAETNEALAPKVEAIVLPKVGKKARGEGAAKERVEAAPADGEAPAPKRRGRPRKDASAGAPQAAEATEAPAPDAGTVAAE